MSRSILHGMCLIGLFITLVLPTPCPGQQQPKLKSLKALITPYISNGPFFIAQEEGFFREEGLDVEFIRFSVSSKALPALINGDLDVISGLPSAGHFNAIASGVPLRIVADRGHIPDIGQGCPAYAYMVRHDLLPGDPLANLKKIERLRFASHPRVSPIDVVFDKFLNYTGLALEEIEIVGLASPNRLDAFSSAAIDFSMVVEPYITLTEETGYAGTWLDASVIAPGFQMSNIYYGPNLLTKDPRAGVAFMKAYLRGTARYIEGKTNRNVAILNKYTGLEQNLLQSCCWTAIRPDGYINANSLLEFQELLLQRGMIDRLVKIEEFWDPFYVNSAGNLLAGQPR